MRIVSPSLENDIQNFEKKKSAKQKVFSFFQIEKRTKKKKTQKEQMVTASTGTASGLTTTSDIAENATTTDVVGEAPMTAEVDRSSVS